MSKMDGLRAMREARYAEATARAAKASGPGKPAAATKPAATKAAAKPAEPAASPETVPSDSGLCGHKAISGRTCTRERGHAAKSHRYS